MTGSFIGVGVGPGDPELLTLKAYNAIKAAPVVAYLSNRTGHSQAKTIARLAFEARSEEAQEIPIVMPMSLDRSLANQAYDEGAQQIRSCLDAGQDVVFLCEGDPLFFGSFAYVLERLSNSYDTHVVPGISSVNAASAALKSPLSMQQESFVVVSGRHSDEQIATALTAHDTVVIMKAGQARSRLLNLIETSGRTNDARYLEYIGREEQRIVSQLTELEDTAGPYFSLFVVTKNRTRSQTRNQTKNRSNTASAAGLDNE